MLDDSIDEIRRLLTEISEIYARAADQPTVAQIREVLPDARARQYDVEFRIHRAFTRQARDDRARPDGG